MVRLLWWYRWELLDGAVVLACAACLWTLAAQLVAPLIPGPPPPAPPVALQDMCDRIHIGMPWGQACRVAASDCPAASLPPFAPAVIYVLDNRDTLVVSNGSFARHRGDWKLKVTWGSDGSVRTKALSWAGKEPELLDRLRYVIGR